MSTSADLRRDAADQCVTELTDALSLILTAELESTDAEAVRSFLAINASDIGTLHELAVLAGDADDVAQASYDWFRAKLVISLREAGIGTDRQLGILQSVEDVAVNNFDELADTAAAIMDPAA